MRLVSVVLILLNVLVMILEQVKHASQQICLQLRHSSSLSCLEKERVYDNACTQFDFFTWENSYYRAIFSINENV